VDLARLEEVATLMRSTAPPFTSDLLLLAMRST
jgi:hypothetical protein